MDKYESIVTIASQGNMSKLELRLFLIILGLCEISGQCLISLETLTKLLNSSKGNASTALAGLAAKGIVTRLDSNNRGRGAKSYVLEINFDSSKYPFSPEYDPITDRTSIKAIAALENKLNKEVRANKTLREENTRLSKSESELRAATQKIQELQEENRRLAEAEKTSKKKSWFGLKQ